MPPSKAADPVRILAVVALYDCKLSNSATLRSLSKATQADAVELRTLIVDNSPEQNPQPALEEGVLYVGVPRNEGLAGAYNRALEIACRDGFDWLLTLDQDTCLPAEFVAGMGSLANSLRDDESVASIVPQLIDGAVCLSPIYVHPVRPTSVPRGFTGLNEREIYALNSASLLRVAALRALGGFPTDFWLDQLDLWLHHHLHRAGKRVFVAGDIQVAHKLSLLSYSSMSTNRFRDFLATESAFFDIYKGPVEDMVLTARLMARYWKHRRLGTKDAIVEELREGMIWRLLHSKRVRIAQWKAMAATRTIHRFDEARKNAESIGSPQVSVCMATFNGERYIAEQIQTILSQLASTDEVIIVDDASQDRTIDIINEIDDSRIHVIRNEQNSGVLAAFERAIRAAAGQVIFLSDQDDLWIADKVSTVLRAFESDVKADIVTSDAELVDESGAPLGPSYFAQRGRFKSGLFANVCRCRYLGCTMAFRSRIRDRILPFPTGKDVLHDLWIGATNAIAGGKTLYIDRPLVKYRRHRSNMTGNSALTLVRRIRIRWDLCRSLAAAWVALHRPGRNETL